VTSTWPRARASDKGHHRSVHTLGSFPCKRKDGARVCPVWTCQEGCGLCHCGEHMNTCSSQRRACGGLALALCVWGVGCPGTCFCVIVSACKSCVELVCVPFALRLLQRATLEASAKLKLSMQLFYPVTHAVTCCTRLCCVTCVAVGVRVRVSRPLFVGASSVI
jgi:hypothetical protein